MAQAKHPSTSPNAWSPTASTNMRTPTSRSSTARWSASGSASGSTAATSRRCRTPGDYYAVTIGRQPMVMVRQPDMQRAGAATTAARTAACRSSATCKGNTGSAFVCSYHAWSFHLDGSVRAIPLAQGLRGHAHDARQPRLRHEARRARRQLPRLRLREPGRRRAVAAASSSARPRSRSTTCATARRSARSRSCRSATA